MGVSTGDSYKIYKTKKSGELPDVLTVRLDGSVLKFKYGETVVADDKLTAECEVISGTKYVRSEVLERIISLVGTSTFKSQDKKPKK